METKIRIRQGDLEIECTGDDAFISTRFPELVSDLLQRMAGQQPGPRPQEPEQPTSQSRLVSVAGNAIDYFTNGAVAEARVIARGLLPELAGTSDSAGRYAFSGQAAGNELFVTVADLDGFADTSSGPFRITTAPLTLTASAAATADLNRQYTNVGLTPSAGSAVVIVHLLDATRGPLEMVPVADLVLIGDDGAPKGLGPFFFGPDGDIKPQEELSVSRSFDGRARAAFLNVPAGDYTLQLTAPGSRTGLQRVTARVRAAGGASIVEAVLGA